MKLLLKKISLSNLLKKRFLILIKYFCKCSNNKKQYKKTFRQLSYNTPRFQFCFAKIPQPNPAKLNTPVLDCVCHANVTNQNLWQKILANWKHLSIINCNIPKSSPFVNQNQNTIHSREMLMFLIQIPLCGIIVSTKFLNFNARICNSN